MSTLRMLAAGAALAASSAGTVTAGDPPTNEQLVAGAIKAMGGDAIGKIESYSATGEMSMPMGTVTSHVLWVRPGRVLITRSMPQMGEMKMGSDGEVGWTSNPMMGGYQLMPADDIVQQAIHARILNLRETMDEFTQLGPPKKTDFHGVRCWEIGVEKDDGAGPPERGAVYFDAGTGLLAGFRVSAEGEPDSTIVLKDWKPVAGVQFFHGMEMTGGPVPVTAVYGEIQVNSVDPSAVALPEEVKELAERQKGKTGAEMALEDFSPQMQQMIRGMLDGLPEDPASLKAMRQGIEAQMDRMPGEYRKAMEYVLKKIDERLK